MKSLAHGFTQHHLHFAVSNNRAIQELKKRIGFLKDGAGFTLLELILAIAILVTVTSVGYSGLLQFRKNSDFNVATADFVNTLNEARADTLNQVKAGTCQPNNTFGGYQITFSNTYDNYTLQLVCVDSNNNPVTTTDIKTTQIPSTITLGFNQVTYYDPIQDPDHNTHLSTSHSILFQAPNATLISSYAATLTGNATVGVGIDQNGVILQE